MMREVFRRRFSRLAKDKTLEWPDLVLIDGGKGQLSAVTDTLKELGVLKRTTLVAIAKGPDRNAGRENFFMNGRPPFSLPPRTPALYYLQRLRDEAHRFAIGTHRARRKKDIKKNPLDNIEGIGPSRKKALLAHFGSAKAIKGASVEELARVEGVSQKMASSIHDYFHES
jgi:excinuclease ABC subunit C